MGVAWRKKLFVDEYLKGLSVAQAASAVGVTCWAGRKYMQDPEVRAAIDAQVEGRRRRVQVDADYVIETIRDTIEKCRQIKPVLDRQGRPITIETEFGEVKAVYEFDAGAVLKGCELLGKHLKLFTDKVEHSGPNGQPLPTEIVIKFVRPGEVEPKALPSPPKQIPEAFDI